MSRLHERAAAWLFTNFMFGPAVEVTKAWMTLRFNDIHEHEGMIKLYSRDMNFLSGCYVSDVIIDKAGQAGQVNEEQ